MGVANISLHLYLGIHFLVHAYNKYFSKFNMNFFELTSCFWEMLSLSHILVAKAITLSAFSSNKYKIVHDHNMV